MKLNFSFRKTPEGTGLLQMQTRSTLMRGIAVFILLVSCMMFPIVDWGNDYSTLYVLLGFMGFITGLFYFLTRYVIRSFSGELVINSRQRVLKVTGGFSVFPWKELKLPEQGILVTDSYVVQSRNGYNTYFRLWMLPFAATETLFSQFSTRVQAQQSQPTNRAPELPQNAISLVVTTDDTPLRIFAESIAKTMSWDIFDFTATQPIYRHAYELDQPFKLRRNQKIEEKIPMPKGIRISGNTFKVRAYSRLAQVFVILFASFVCLFMAMMFWAIRGTPWVMLSPLTIWIVMMLAMTNASYVTADEDGITVRNKIFRLIPVGQVEFMAWNQLEEVKAYKVPRSGWCKVELVSDERRIVIGVNKIEQAHWIVSHLEDKAMEKADRERDLRAGR